MKLQVEIVPLKDISAYPKNTKLHPDEQILQIVKSIQEFGFNDPIAIDAEGTIIEGHGRLLAAKELKLKQVPVIRLGHLSQEQAKAYRITHNKLTLNSDFDLELLKSEFEALQQADFDLELTGFTDEEINALLNPSTSGLTDPDEVPEAPVNPTSRLGDIWLLDKHRVCCGDSTKAEEVGKLTMGRKTQLCVTSPPYFVGKEYEKQSNEEDILKFINTISESIISYIDDSRRVIINCSTTAWSNITGGNVDYRLNLDWWQSAFRRLGWFTRSIRIWSKHGGLIHNSPKADIVDMHWEFLATFYNSKANYRGQNRVGGAESWSTLGVWDGIHGERQIVHSAPFPIIIPERFILIYSDIGEIIFDPFGGSGSTLIACEQTGRVCRMMEIEPCYIDVIVKRWQGFTGKKATLEGDGRTFDEMIKARS